MATIEVRRPHAIGKERARAAAQRVADSLIEKLEGAYEWKGDAIHYRRTGASAVITVRDSDIEVAVDLSLPLRPLKGKIEEKVRVYLDENLK